MPRLRRPGNDALQALDVGHVDFNDPRALVIATGGTDAEAGPRLIREAS